MKKFSEFIGTIREAEAEQKSDLQKSYQDYFQKKLKKFGVKSPADLDDEKKKEFFNEISKDWESGKGVKEAEEPSDEESIVNEAMSFDEIKDKYLENPYGIGAQIVTYEEGERGNPNRLVFKSGERSRRDEIAKKLKDFGIPAKKMSNSTQDKSYKYRYVLTLFESVEANEIEINEGAILNAIKPGLEGDVKDSVGALEKLLQSTGAIIDYKHADKLADCIIDIIDAAKQEARDEYSD